MLPGRDAISHAAGQEAVVPDLEPSRYAGLETPVRSSSDRPCLSTAVQHAISAIARRAIARWKLLQHRAVQGDVPLARRRLQHSEVDKYAGAISGEGVLVFSIAILQYWVSVGLRSFVNGAAERRHI